MVLLVNWIFDGQEMMSDTINYDELWQDCAPSIAWGNVGLFVGIVCGYVLTISGALMGYLPYWVASFICAYLAFASFSVAHEACHGSIIQMGAGPQWISDAIGWISTIPFLLLPYRLLQRMHERHHAYTNDPARDPDYFKSGQPWYQILLRIYLVPFKYHWMVLSPLRHNPHYRKTYVSSALYMLFTASLLSGLWATGHIRELIYFALLPAAASMFSLVFFYDYLPHHPHKSLGRHHNSRVILGQFFKLASLGQSYHLVHHLYPRVPWYRYEDLYHRIAPDLDAKQSPVEAFSSDSRPGLLQSRFTKILHNNQCSVHASLTVTAIEPLCDDAVEVVLALPDNERLRYSAGQYVVISAWLNNQQVSRCYSLCSAPRDGELRIAVRQVEAGVFSRYINQQLRVGDELIVQGPYGDFCYPPQHSKPVDELVLYAAGSGITPMLAICEAALQQPRAPRITLIYACRNSSHAILLPRFQELQRQYPQQLDIQLLMSRLDIGKKRLSPELIHHRHHQHSANTDYYICGPTGFNAMILDTLQQLGAQPDRLHTEVFRTAITAPEGPVFDVQVHLNDGRQHHLKVASNQTVLEVANDRGMELPQGCGSGSCGTCKMKLQRGEPQALSNSIAGLSKREQDAGYTLACQCRPVSNLHLEEANQ